MEIFFFFFLFFYLWKTNKLDVAVGRTDWDGLEDGFDKALESCKPLGELIGSNTHQEFPGTSFSSCSFLTPLPASPGLPDPTTLELRGPEATRTDLRCHQKRSQRPPEHIPEATGAAWSAEEGMVWGVPFQKGGIASFEHLSEMQKLGRTLSAGCSCGTGLEYPGWVWTAALLCRVFDLFNFTVSGLSCTSAHTGARRDLYKIGFLGPCTKQVCCHHGLVQHCFRFRFLTELQRKICPEFCRNVSILAVQTLLCKTALGFLHECLICFFWWQMLLSS